MSEFRPFFFKLVLMFEHVGSYYLLIILFYFDLILSVEIKCSQEEVQEDEREARVVA